MYPSFLSVTDVCPESASFETTDLVPYLVEQLGSYAPSRLRFARACPVFALVAALDYVRCSRGRLRSACFPLHFDALFSC